MDHLLKVIYTFFLFLVITLFVFKCCVLVIILVVSKLKTQVVPLVSITCITSWCSYTWLTRFNNDFKFLLAIIFKCRFLCYVNCMCNNMRLKLHYLYISKFNKV